MKINISSYRLYSSEELRSYAEKGLISFVDCEDSSISECFLYMLEGLYTEEEMEKAKEDAYDSGHTDGYSEGWDDRFNY